MRRTVAITGGAGFVGLAVAEALIAQGDAVLLLDIAPPDPHLAARPEIQAARFQRCDVMAPDALAQALHGCDLLIHAAAITPNAQTARTDRARIVDLNVGGAVRALEAAASAGLRDVILLSSIAIYGSRGTGENSLYESALPQPDSLYGETKKAAESLCSHCAMALGLRLAILRLGPLFGPWESLREGRPDLSPQAQILQRAAAGLPVRLAHDMVGDWVYSRDAAAMIVAAARHMEAAAGQCFNIGSGYRFALTDWAEAMGLERPQTGADAPDIAPRAHPARPAMSIAAITALTGHPGGRSMAEAVTDERAFRAAEPTEKDLRP